MMHRQLRSGGSGHACFPKSIDPQRPTVNGSPRGRHVCWKNHNLADKATERHIALKSHADTHVAPYAPT
jgi:hypothetical protein